MSLAIEKKSKTSSDLVKQGERIAKKLFNQQVKWCDPNFRARFDNLNTDASFPQSPENTLGLVDEFDLPPVEKIILQTSIESSFPDNYTSSIIIIIIYNLMITLKKIVDCYKRGEFHTPNLQVIDKIFSDEIIAFPDKVMVDLTFYRTLFKESCFTNIIFCNGTFNSSGFENCYFKGCTFSNIPFQEMTCLKCFFKDCLFMDCLLLDNEISETIFDSCTFSNGSLDDAEFQSCYFINTGFRDVLFGCGTLIDSKFFNSTKSIEFEGKVFFYDIFYQINKFYID